MLPDLKVSKKYANAFFEAAKKGDYVNKAKKDLEYFADIYSKYEKSFNLINGPIYSAQARVGFIENIAKNFKLYGATVKLLLLIAENRRLNLIQSITDSYLELCRELNNEKLIEVTSVSKLEQSDIVAMQKYFSKKLNKGVLVKNIIDESIMGGVVIKIDSFVLDSSVSNKLNNINLLIKNRINVWGR